MTTPAWQAAENGVPGHLAATNQSAELNQLLAAHEIFPVYQGAQVLTPAGGTQFTWLTYGNGIDLDQPFTLSGTTIGRVVLPIKPVGNGADLTVTLYPDNGSGAPNLASPVSATSLPAGAIETLAAPSGLLNGAPLATAVNNGAYFTGSVTPTPWAPPAGGTGGASITSSFTYDGDYIIGVGGANLTSGAPLTGVNSFQYLGAGALAQPVPQPALPVATNVAAVAICNGSIVVMGGTTDVYVTTTTNVWVASWDSGTGIVGSWSQQAALPAASMFAASAASGTTVYYVGGCDPTFTPTAAVRYATIDNGQVGAWTAGPSLPQALFSPMVAVVGSWLIVIGGINSSTSTVTSTVYYAPINASGALGAWQTGPSLPTPVSAFSPGFSTVVADDLIAIVAGQGNSGLAPISTIQTIAVTANGLAPAWQSSTWSEAANLPVASFATGNGSYDVIALNFGSSRTEYSSLTSVPLISIPLYATGLTSGAKYHVVLQQHQNATAADYLAFGIIDDTALPLNALRSSRHSGTWTTVASNWAVPMSVYNDSASGSVWHTWEDPNAYNVAQRTSTLLYNSYQLPIGLVEQTLKANPPRNSNPTFTSGVSPWTATGGALTQSSAQTHGGYAFSGLLTPSGSAGTASALSELFPVNAGGGPFYGSVTWMLLDGWFYSTPGYSNFSGSVNWYDQGKNYLSTSNHTQALTAATWAHVQNYYLVPATAAYAQINALEAGTPASSALLYLSDVFMIASQECVGSLTSAAAIRYPAAAPWPPLGVEQLL